ncbi:MAG: DUF2924 domain-containing protein [Heliobacteriaceae bacterium]|jgi:hypothetical protein|nr:DUF2924 domain-containing protein [Heliobacteriaceae bacterium]
MKDKYENITREKLLDAWIKMFGKAPAQGLSRSFLIKHLIYQEQVNKSKGLSTSSQRLINKLISKYSTASELKDSDVQVLNGFSIQAGTKLIREFRGEKHEVTTLEKGFEYRGRFYKSLSAIANEITGTRWNGKVFFGVAK